MKRRQFLTSAAAGALGAGLPLSAGTARPKSEIPDDVPRIREYRTLGRTGFRISDLCAGSIMDEGVLGRALDSGMNYIDSAEEYPGHHRVVARTLKGRDRSSVFLTTKLEVQADKSKEGFLKRARKCLEELETEYVDCLLMHIPERPETLATPGFHDAMRELKAEGRVKFVGASHHGSFWLQAPEMGMDQVLLAAAEDGRFDLFLLAYNFLQMDRGDRVLTVCREKNIGAVLMKTKPVGIYYSLKSRVENLESEKKDVNPLIREGLQRYKEMIEKAEGFIRDNNLGSPEEIQAAAVRFCLDNPDVSSVCCRAANYDELESYLRLSGTRTNGADKTALAAYKDGCGTLYCRHACGECEPACPHGVPVNTILRYNHYFAAQGREREAMEFYAAIPGARADACAACPGHCESACPYGVPAKGMLLLAHSCLALTSY